MTAFKKWILEDENREIIPPEMVPVLINELDTNVVALKGSSVFPVTLGLVANVSYTCILKP